MLLSFACLESISNLLDRVGTAMSDQNDAIDDDCQSLILADCNMAQSSSALKALVTNLLTFNDECCIAIDEIGNVLAFNHRASDLVDLPLFTSLRPDTWNDYYGVFHPNSLKICSIDQLPLYKALQGQMVEEQELLYRNFDSVCHLSISARPLLDEQSRIVGAIACFRNMDSLSELNMRKLSTLVHEELLFRVFNDMQNPLLGANKVLELILRGGLGSLTQEQYQILSQLKINNNTIIRGLHNFLDICRYEGIGPVFKPSFNIQTSLSRDLSLCLEEFMTLSEQKSISFLKNIPDNVFIYADSYAIKRVIYNVLDNAVKFSPEYSTIIITLSAGKDLAVLKIRDQGPGISLSDQGNIFAGLFQGLHGKRLSSGTGIGLYTAKKIVECFKGSICVKSKEGQGAEFQIEFPLASPT